MSLLLTFRRHDACGNLGHEAKVAEFAVRVGPGPGTQLAKLVYQPQQARRAEHACRTHGEQDDVTPRVKQLLHAPKEPSTNQI